ncbi:hypothetical protein SAMN05444166_8193 [Singulisphaera sp. GP187]|uniref:hypothetical protein n=1 Tax=Singulisphaera sp. GP187 TaxID=1882752 RepID=UPI000926D849|nr:hypothetical protein [Singulisphaera sp. GP187]SIO66716.1 hypothetical protein SAMN05444166_8193 [Singulisphaera sp. GP187]
MAPLKYTKYVTLTLVLIWPQVASAGMPSVTLADVSRAVGGLTQTGLTGLARQRLEVISFFLVGLLACTGVIRWVWNGLRNDFPVLPRLSYARALGIIVLWGLLFVLVLTMISGARELMTPGAWEKQGLTHRLVPPSPPAPPIEAEIAVRDEAIRRLGDQLAEYATVHRGVFPTPEQAVEVEEPLWRVPVPPGGRYLYVGGQMPDEEMWMSPTILAYEPDSVGADRLVLMTDRSVRWLPASEIERLLPSRKP